MDLNYLYEALNDGEPFELVHFPSNHHPNSPVPIYENSELSLATWGLYGSLANVNSPTTTFWHDEELNWAAKGLLGYLANAKSVSRECSLKELLNCSADNPLNVGLIVAGLEALSFLYRSHNSNNEIVIKLAGDINA